MCVSVAICTWNRSALLDRTLASLHQLAIPSAVEWELLVVNNDCSDDTDDVVRATPAAFRCAACASRNGASPTPATPPCRPLEAT